jgi:fucose permease
MTSPQIYEKRQPSLVLLAIIYATMLMFGLVENMKGVSFPLIKAEFNAAYDSQGGMVSMTWFGYVLFCLAASLFLHRFGIKKSILAGYLLVCFGAITTLAAPSFWSAGLALLVVNAGFGFYEVGTNALATVVFTSRAALMMGLMHFFYGFGAILGPKLAGTLIDQAGFAWRQVYLAIIFPTALVFLVVLATRFKGRTANENATEAPARINFIQALRSPVVWLFCITLGFMEVIEFGAANWGGLYLKDVYGLDPSTVGASFVSSFYLLFTISRLVSGFAIEKIGYLPSLFAALFGSIVLFFLGFLLGEQGIWILPGTGLFIAIMWPTIMAVGMQVFGDDAPAVTSVIITVSGAINGIFQLVIGLTSQYVGDAWGYRSCLLYGIVALVSLTFLVKHLKTAKPLFSKSISSSPSVKN